MPTRIALSASFPARPIVRPLARLCERLSFEVELSVDLFTDSSEPVASPPDWQVALIRTQDWTIGATSPRQAGQLFNANLDRFMTRIGDGQSWCSRGGLVLVCPSAPGSTHGAFENLITERLSGHPLVTAVNADQVLARYSVRQPYRDVALAGEHLFSNHFFIAMAAEVMRRVHARERPPVKLIAVDGDYTLWEGACAEAGPAGVKVGPGRAEFQRRLAWLSRHGVLVCLLSQNKLSDVAKVFKDNQGLPLAWQDLVLVKAGWSGKPLMLKEAAAELGIAAGATVFIDDNPGECQRMRSEYPEVLTVRFPQQDAAARTFIDHLWPLDLPAWTQEDLERTARYRSDLRRRHPASPPGARQTQQDPPPQITIRPAEVADVSRIVQLTERTTQFNVYPRRLSERQVTHMLQSQSDECLVAEVSDRYGRYGLTGVITYRVVAEQLRVGTFLLSCRVMHRGVEARMLCHVARIALKRGIDTIVFNVRLTDRNIPARDFINHLDAGWAPADGKDFQVEVSTSRALRAQRQAAQSTDPPPAWTAGAKRQPGGQRFLAALAESLTDAESLHRELCSTPQEPQHGQLPSRSRPHGLWVTALLHAWEEALGVTGISPHDHLFDAWGATSVEALVAVSTLRRDLDRTLPLGQVMALPTVAQQATAITASCSAVPILTGVRSGDDVPVLFFAPAGGLGYGYLELIRALDSRLQRRHPMLIAQAPELSRFDVPLMELPTLVELYRTEIRAAAGAVPMIIAGWSFGAIVAYEVAAALRADDIGVAALLLFDPPSRAPAPAQLKSDRPLTQFFELLDPYAIDAESLRLIDRTIFPEQPELSMPELPDVWRALLGRLLDTATPVERSRMLIHELEPMNVLRAAQVWKKNQVSVQRCVARRQVGCTVHVFQPDSSPHEHVLSDALQREQVHRLAYQLVPVGELSPHSAMMEPRNVARFVDDVAAAIHTVECT